MTIQSRKNTIGTSVLKINKESILIITKKGPHQRKIYTKILINQTTLQKEWRWKRTAKTFRSQYLMDLVKRNITWNLWRLWQIMKQLYKQLAQTMQCPMTRLFSLKTIRCTPNRLKSSWIPQSWKDQVIIPINIGAANI